MPSFFLCLCAAGSALAQQPVYRCGQEYTNAPLDASRCERVAVQSITVIPGTRVQGAAVAAPVAPQSAALPAVAGSPQRQRDEMARSILGTELEQARQRHARLLDEYRQGEPVRTPEEEQNLSQYPKRVASLKEALERSQRDIESLQRELMRRKTLAAMP